MNKKLIINLPFQCRTQGQDVSGEYHNIAGVNMLEVDLGSAGIALPSARIDIDPAWHLNGDQLEAINEAVTNTLIETFVRQVIMARLISMPVPQPKY